MVLNWTIVIQLQCVVLFRDWSLWGNVEGDFFVLYLQYHVEPLGLALVVQEVEKSGRENSK